MNDYWMQRVRREYVGGNPRFYFPVRPLGWVKLIGVVLIGFGVLFMWSSAQDVLRALQKWAHESPDGMEILSCLINLPFLIAGCVPLVIGLLILFGRCRVEWTDGRLCAAEILGPFRWTRRLPRKPIRKLEVGAASSRTANSPPKEIPTFSAMVAEFEDGSKKLVALGYPKDWLLPVAKELSSYAGGSATSTLARTVEVVETSLATEQDEDVLQQPVGSKVRVENHVSGLQLVVPPAGIWRGSKGLLFFAFVWCGFMMVFTTLVVRSTSKGPDDVWIFYLFIAGFWIIGIGLLAGAINMGRRSAVLAAEGGRLVAETRGLFGTKQQNWEQSEIVTIRAGPSGMEVNNRPVIELQVHPRVGKKVGLLAGRDETELRWMATQLRRALNVPANPPES